MERPVDWVESARGKGNGSREKEALTQARALAVRQTTVPTVTAADQVSVVLEPDEGEYQGVAAAAQTDRPGHGGRAKFTGSAHGDG